MPANVEIKAKLRNREEVLETAKRLSGGNGERSFRGSVVCFKRTLLCPQAPFWFRKTRFLTVPMEGLRYDPAYLHTKPATFPPSIPFPGQLRVQTGCPGQLIFYNREDIAGPKLSQYRISKVKVHRPSCLRSSCFA